MTKNTINIKIKSLEELDNYFSNYKENLSNINLVCYIWCEYGHLSIFMNDFFKNFFDFVEGKIIGLCFPGHEIIYEGKVDELITLVDFIDTTRAYKNNKETKLLISKFKSMTDRGEAFWETIKNFDQKEFVKIINKYKFKNIVHKISNELWRRGLFPGAFRRGRHTISKKYVPKGYDFIAERKNNYLLIKKNEKNTEVYRTNNNFKNLKVKSKINDFIIKWKTKELTLPFIYATGEKNFYWLENHPYKKHVLGWVLENWDKSDKKFEKIIDGEYCSIFVKNSWKSRQFRSSNINDFIVTNKNGTGGKTYVGHVNFDFVKKLCRYFIKRKKKLVIIDDLISYKLDDYMNNSEYIQRIKMEKHLDLRTLLNIVNFSDIFMGPPTAPIDLALYYCKTNLVYIGSDLGVHKKPWIKKIQKMNNKKSHMVDFNDRNYFKKLKNFIGNVVL